MPTRHSDRPRGEAGNLPKVGQVSRLVESLKARWPLCRPSQEYRPSEAALPSPGPEVGGTPLEVHATYGVLPVGSGDGYHGKDAPSWLQTEYRCVESVAFFRDETGFDLSLSAYCIWAHHGV